MSVAAIFAADTHISEATWASRSAIQGDSFFGFQQLCELAIKHRVPLVVAGDCWELMHDPKPSSGTIGFIREQLDTLELEGIPFLFVNGQHDKLAVPFWFNSIHSHVEHVGGKSFKLGGKNWYGVDFFESHQADQVYAEIPKEVDGVVIHQRWGEFAGSKHFASESLTSIPQAKAIVSGDMHKLIVTKAGQQLQVSPGATHMRSLSEPAEHYAIAYDPDAESEPFSPIKLKSRPILRLEVINETEWIDEIPNVVEAITALQEAAWEDGIPHEVARPLVVIEDHVPCGAGDLLLKATDIAHVVTKIATDDTGSDADLAEVVSDIEDLAEIAARVGVRRGMSAPALQLLACVIEGNKSLEDAALSLTGEDNAETS